MKRSVHALLQIVLVVLLLPITACSRPAPDEAALRATLDAMEAAGEARSVDAFMDHVATDFAGPDEAPDTRSLQRFLRVLVLRARAIDVTRTSTEIQMYHGRAEVQIRLLIQADTGGFLSEGRPILARTAWRIDGGEWKLIRAQWE